MSWKQIVCACVCVCAEGCEAMCANQLVFFAGCGGPVLEFYRPSLGLVNRHLSQE